MKTRPVQFESIEALRETWNQVMHKLAKQIMQDWVDQHEASVNQLVQPVCNEIKDCKPDAGK